MLARDPRRVLGNVHGIAQLDLDQGGRLARTGRWWYLRIGMDDYEPAGVDVPTPFDEFMGHLATPEGIRDSLDAVGLNREAPEHRTDTQLLPWVG